MFLVVLERDLWGNLLKTVIAFGVQEEEKNRKRETERKKTHKEWVEGWAGVQAGGREGRHVK